ncbi:D-alanyl-D-alanine carboxypeptidase family protein [Brevibacillus sp. SYSU BS000544]|uniref:D-alanyl-D-alanine carboxypeptidase family protein n=1 Tax=Brevibacillus sp. SYSU BS000544 TaxID=3416443 RepID=UPI003CE49DD2
MKYLNRISGVLVVFLFCHWLLTPPSSASAAVKPPSISAESAALIDVQSGRILYQKEGDKKMRIASLTKTMTAIVAIEEANLQDVVKVPNEAVGVEGSSIYLKKGEQLKLEELLYGLMLRSGNDAAVAISHHVGGSVPGFVHLMNEKAAMIGMTHTNFNNPHGLDDSNMHYSTANDMVKLSAYALKNPTFRKIVSTKVTNISWEGENWDRRLQNKNKMLYLYKGADGVKTGYTKLAKRCLASSATRDGRQLAVITLNAPDDWNDSSELMDWGFQQFQQEKIISKGAAIGGDLNIAPIKEGLNLVTLNDFFYPLKAGEKSQIHTNVQLLNKNVPLDKNWIGEHVGYVQVYLDKQLIGKIPLIVQDDQTTFQPLEIATSKDTFWAIVLEVLLGGFYHA